MWRFYRLGLALRLRDASVRVCLGNLSIRFTLHEKHIFRLSTFYNFFAR